MAKKILNKSEVIADISTKINDNIDAAETLLNNAS